MEISLERYRPSRSLGSEALMEPLLESGFRRASGQSLCGAVAWTFLLDKSWVQAEQRLARCSG